MELGAVKHSVILGISINPFSGESQCRVLARCAASCASSRKGEFLEVTILLAHLIWINIFCSLSSIMCDGLSQACPTKGAEID